MYNDSNNIQQHALALLDLIKMYENPLDNSCLSSVIFKSTIHEDYASTAQQDAEAFFSELCGMFPDTLRKCFQFTLQRERKCIDKSCPRKYLTNFELRNVF